MSAKRLAQWLLALALVSFVAAGSGRAVASAQESAPEASQSAPKHESLGTELAKETREADGEEEEENSNLKHSAVVQKFAKVTGLSVHQAHLVATGLNFALIVFLIYWFARKSVPAALRNRTESIQRALEEARAASQDANRRLAEIEARLSKLDVEIGQMQSASEKEAEAEEARIKAAAEEDMRKVVQAAEQEIATAAKQARRELTTYTADLAVALARKQIHIDAAADQALVSNFAGKLSSDSGRKDRS